HVACTCLAHTQPPSPTLHPYTTLFRSLVVRGHRRRRGGARVGAVVVRRAGGERVRGRGGRGDDAALQRPRDAAVAALEREEVERSEEHTSELQSVSNLVCRLVLEKNQC